MYSRYECLGTPLQKTYWSSQMFVPLFRLNENVTATSTDWYWCVVLVSQRPGVVLTSWHDFWSGKQLLVKFSREIISLPLPPLFFAGSCISGNCKEYKIMPMQTSQPSIYLKYVIGSGFLKVVLFCFNYINVYYVIWTILGVLGSLLGSSYAS